MEVDKKNSEEMGDIMPGARDLTDEEITALEAERAAEAEKELAPAKAAAKFFSVWVPAYLDIGPPLLRGAAAAR